MEKWLPKISRWSVRLNLVIFAASIAGVIVCWGKIPETIPSHFNGWGEADAWSDKGILILLLFVIVIFQGMFAICIYYLKMSMASRYETEREKSSYPGIHAMLCLLQLVLMAVFAYIIWCSATKRNLGKGFLPVTLVCVTFPVAGMILSQRKGAVLNPSEKRQYRLREKTEKGIVYRTKIDGWLGAVCIASLFMPLLALTELFEGKPVSSAGWLGFVCIFLCTWGLIFPLLVGIRYTCYDTHLKIRCSYLGTVRIPYTSITHMKETRSPLSSAAMSLDRIQIDYEIGGRHQSVLISPVRKKEFMAYVKEKQEKN